jgi:hypothetical protein
VDTFADLDLLLLCSTLVAVFIAAGFAGTRAGGARRALRLLLGTGAALGGLALLLLSLRENQ